MIFLFYTNLLHIYNSSAALHCDALMLQLVMFGLLTDTLHYPTGGYL